MISSLIIRHGRKRSSLFVLCDETFHLFESVEDVEGRRGKFDASVLLVAILRRRRRLFRQNPELVQWEAVNRATEMQPSLINKKIFFWYRIHNTPFSS